MNSLGHSCFDDHSAIAETVRKNKERFKKAVKVFRNPLFGKKVPVVKSVMMYGEPRRVRERSELKTSDVLRGIVMEHIHIH